MTTEGRQTNKKPILYGFWLSPYMSLVAHILKESDIQFQYERVSPFNGATRSSQHLARNPLGKIPCFEDTDGVLVSESQAICRYLSRTNDQAQKYYPCHQPVLCSEVDSANDFLNFSISGPFFNWFVVGAYFPQAWGLKTEHESSIFSSWSLLMTKMALGRLTGGAQMSPFLFGKEPLLPDFHLFHILELSKTFSGIFDIPPMNLVTGDPVLQGFYDAIKSRPSTQYILQLQAEEFDLTRRELFEEFGKSSEDLLKPARAALEMMFGHAV